MKIKMKLEKAIERCEELIKAEHSNWIGFSNQKAIEALLIELQARQKLQDKIIEKIEELSEKTISETDETTLIRYTIEINILQEVLEED